MEKKECLDGRALITTVKIQDEAGSKAMKKPIGTYVTVESQLMRNGDFEEREPLLLCICGFSRPQNDGCPFYNETFQTGIWQYIFRGKSVWLRQCDCTGSYGADGD